MKFKNCAFLDFTDKNIRQKFTSSIQKVEKEMPIQISNLSYFDSKENKGVRLGFKIDTKNKKVRINKSSGKEI